MNKHFLSLNTNVQWCKQLTVLQLPLQEQQRLKEAAAAAAAAKARQRVDESSEELIVHERQRGRVCTVCVRAYSCCGRLLMGLVVLGTACLVTGVILSVKEVDMFPAWFLLIVFGGVRVLGF